MQGSWSLNRVMVNPMNRMGSSKPPSDFLAWEVQPTLRLVSVARNKAVFVLWWEMSRPLRQNQHETWSCKISFETDHFTSFHAVFRFFLPLFDPIRLVYFDTLGHILSLWFFQGLAARSDASKHWIPEVQGGNLGVQLNAQLDGFCIHLCPYPHTHIYIYIYIV